MTWEQYFIKLASVVAEKSKDRSTKVGVVIVGPEKEVRSTGFNGFPRGIDDDIEERHERPIKYEWTEHAERNAIYHAARIGVSLNGCSMYFNYEPVPCTVCARAIIQAGITRLIGYRNRPFPGIGYWPTSLETAKEMLNEAGVEIVYLDDS